MTGVTLLDIMDNIDEEVTMAQFSLAITMKNVGVMIGSFGSGMISDRHQDKTNLLLVCGLVILALTALWKPFIIYLPTLAVVFFLDGVAVGSLGAGKSHPLHLSFFMSLCLPPSFYPIFWICIVSLHPKGAVFSL